MSPRLTNSLRVSERGDAPRASQDDVTFMVRGVTEGLREHQRWLYRRFAPGLLRRLRSRYGSRQRLDAEELLQDAFVFFLRRGERSVLNRFLDRVSPRDRTSARLERFLWDQACGIASNRRRAAMRRPPQTEFVDELDSPRMRPETEAESRDLMRRLDARLREGDPGVYLYFKLRYVDGRTPKEIGAFTGWPRATIYNMKARLDRAVKAHLDGLR